MAETFNATLSPMLVMFLCIVIGFVLNKSRVVPENTATVLSKLENFVIVPALVINTFMKYCTVQSITENFKMVLYCAVALVIALAIALPLSGVFTKDEYKRNIYKYALTFGNFGFMGNAIVPAILGESMLYNYMLYTLLLQIAVYTWGVMILIPMGEAKKSVAKSLINPTFISIIIGGTLGLTGISDVIPVFAANTIGSISSCMAPIAMILTGFVIGNFNVLKLLKNGRVYIATILRLFVLPAVFIIVLGLLGADKLALVFTLFAFGTPLGLNTVIFPAAYGGDTSTGASMAMISHTLSVITIPIMFSLLIKLFG